MYEKTFVVKVDNNPCTLYLTPNTEMVLNPYYERAVHDQNSKNDTVVKIVIEWEHQQHV